MRYPTKVTKIGILVKKNNFLIKRELTITKLSFETINLLTPCVIAYLFTIIKDFKLNYQLAPGAKSIQQAAIEKQVNESPYMENLLVRITVFFVQKPVI